jgi:serine/threonine protein phosphatase 1
MISRQIIIGDVHGHYQALCELLEAIAPAADESVHFLGDLIDRGPCSAQVVELVKTHCYPCVLGNHEQMLLEVVAGDPEQSGDALQSWLYSGGYSTLVSYNNQIPPEHIEWLKSLPKYLDLGAIWLVHAGVVPHLPIQEQDTDIFCWVRDEFHSMPAPYFSDKLIVAGHTMTFTFPGVKPGRLAAGSGWLDIDTGAYHSNSGWLTGLDMTNRLVYQVNSKTSEGRKFNLAEITTTVSPEAVYARRKRRA